MTRVNLLPRPGRANAGRNKCTGWVLLGCAAYLLLNKQLPNFIPGRAGPLDGRPARSSPPTVPIASAAAGLAPVALFASDAQAAGEAAVQVEAASSLSALAYQAFSLTFVSEIGDKTFFIAAVLAAGAAENAKVLTFVGAIGALVVMTLGAVAIGQVFHYVPNLAGGVPLDDYLAVLAFGFFGTKLLVDAWGMPDDGSILAEEKEEAEEDIKGFNTGSSGSGGTAMLVLPPLVIQAFFLVFAAEIGDRSFFTAIALSATGGPEGAATVFAGGIAAHAIATILAVLVGEVISGYVSEKVIAYIGGFLFLFFAAGITKDIVEAGGLEVFAALR